MYTINICALPNLFVSYSDEEHLPTVFKSFMQQLLDYDSTILLSVAFSSSLSKQLKTFTAASNIYVEFNHSAEEILDIKNIDEFIQQLFSEMKSRTTLLKNKRLILLPFIIVLMDDIFEVLRSKNRKITSAFIQLLRIGASAKIFFIMGSAGIYRNLLQQIINDIPGNYKNNNKNVTAKDSHGLGAELVINFDGLIFYKETGEASYRKYYPLEKTTL